jgi:hypothetical protein
VGHNGITVKRRKITDYKPDAHNANRGTERGQYMIDRSLEDVGLARSIVAAADDTVPAGNKTLQAAVDAGIEDVIEVETDGHELVVVKRRDWPTVDAEPARKYAYYDNRASEVGLDWNAEQIVADLQIGVDLSGMFLDWELEKMQLAPDDVNDWEDEWKGMPEFEQEDLTPDSSINVHFATPEDRQAFAELIGQKLTENTKSIWYPAAEIRRFMDKRYVEES